MNARDTARASMEVFVQTCKEITPVTAVTLGIEADIVKKVHLIPVNMDNHYMRTISSMWRNFYSNLL